MTSRWLSWNQKANRSIAKVWQRQYTHDLLMNPIPPTKATRFHNDCWRVAIPWFFSKAQVVPIGTRHRPSAIQLFGHSGSRRFIHTSGFPRKLRVCIEKVRRLNSSYGLVQGKGTECYGRLSSNAGLALIDFWWSPIWELTSIWENVDSSPNVLIRVLESSR